jgi:transcriptional regulator with XRE-family HTH domain
MALAHKAGLDRTYIGGIERGERNVALINIEKIAKALGVTVDELLRF